ncbi:MAG TPA: glycine zipper 2TM domain-containing protein [Gammaproteobacteria bacterium]|nr:glycine zipper 2TM domain-containing protein [Gammaproteobacteria bacterium]
MSNARSSGINAGTVIGGVVGAVAGSQVGSGRGNTLATVAGAVGGAVIGTSIENQNAAQMYNIQVRLDNGNYETITQKGSVADLRVGDRVRIQNGYAYRA